MKVPFKACWNLTFPDDIYLWVGPDGMPITLKDVEEGLLGIRKDIRKRQLLKTKKPKGKVALGFLNNVQRFPVLEVDPQAIEVPGTLTNSPATERQLVHNVIRLLAIARQ